MSLIQDAKECSIEWLESRLRPWLFAQLEWCLLWDAKAKEVVPVLDTGEKLERWEA